MGKASIYDKASGRGSLKLKRPTTTTVKKKTDHKNHHLNHHETDSSHADDSHTPPPPSSSSSAQSDEPPPPSSSSPSSSSSLFAEAFLDGLSSLTPAERSFRLAQQKRESKRVDSRLKLTHRERMERLNAHLASLSEHFDIPKVGPG
eukprot:GHVS01056589.1.p1 GENE.GHVS01056589.1~~GHVS01056589.1.p1  ORF type:complete len:147 (+),score=58.35 GHVS01056589.1:285-725(+)